MSAGKSSRRRTAHKYVDRIRLTVSRRCLQREEFGRESLAEKKIPKRFAPPGTTIGVKESLLNVEPAKKEASVKKKEPHEDYSLVAIVGKVTGADDG
jgi:hypothetical protein